MSKSWIFILAGFFVILFYGCGGDGSGNGSQPDNPVPTLASIDPASKVDHMPTFTLTVKGSQFISGSRIVFNGVTKSTNYVSGTELTCTIEPDDIKITGFLTQSLNRFTSAQDSTVPVLVRNPSPGGGDSSAVNFNIKSSYDFSEPKEISVQKSHNWSSLNAVAVDGNNNVYAMWPDGGTETDPMDMYITHSSDGGETWSPQYNLSNNTGDSWNPSLAVNPDGHVYAAWRDESAGASDILVSKSTDNGQTWLPAVNVTNSLFWAYLPCLAIDGSGIVYLLWMESNHIQFSRSSDGGTFWIPKKTLSSPGSNYHFPALCSDTEGNLYAAWIKSQGNTQEIQFCMSSDGGDNWSTPITISQNSGSNYDLSLGLTGNGAVFAAWELWIPPQSYDVFLTYSTDRGETWSQTVNFSNNENYAYSARIAVDTAGNVVVIWDSEGQQGGIHLRRSIDSGNSWSDAILILGSGSFPALAVDPRGNLHIVIWGSGNKTYHFRTNN